MVPAVTIVGEFLATFKEYPPSQASGALSAIGIGPQVAARMWQVAAFIDARVVKPIVIGGDDQPRMRVGTHQRRPSDSGDHRAAATDMVGRRRPTRSGRRARAAREVGGVADERGDGRDQVADQPFRALAESPPDLTTAAYQRQPRKPRP